MLKCIEDNKRGNGDLEQVGVALKAVKAKKEGLQGQIMESLYLELKELKREKESLEKRADEIMDKGMKVRREYENLIGNAEKGRMEELEERMAI